MTTIVRDVMTTCVVSVPAGAPFATVAAVLSRNGISVVPVVDRGGRLLGVVSATALVGGRDGAGITARELMTTAMRTVTEDSTVAAAARLLVESGVRRLYVTEDGCLAGVVSRRDVLACFLRDDDTIRADVERELLALAPGQPPLGVSVRDGVVLLLGRVEWQGTPAVIGERVRRVPGVVRVLDRLGYTFDGNDEPRLAGTR
jgi:CBS domain-containing protein